MNPAVTIRDGDRTPLARWTVQQILYQGVDWWWWTLAWKGTS